MRAGRRLGGEKDAEMVCGARLISWTCVERRLICVDACGERWLGGVGELGVVLEGR